MRERKKMSLTDSEIRCKCPKMLGQISYCSDCNRLGDDCDGDNEWQE